MEIHDVIVVGARAAGAATALLLARAGHRVVVVERDRRGADTLSTHALMRPAVLQLERWGLLGDVVAAGTPPQHQVVFHYGDRRVPVDVSRPLFAPRRTVLDRVLVEAAERAGADVRFDTAVTGVTRTRGCVDGVVVHDGTRLRGRVVVGADGRRSRIAREVDAPVMRRGDVASATLYGYWAGVEAAGYEWAYRPAVAAGLIPTNDGLTCVYAGVPPERLLRRPGELADLLRDIVAEANPPMAQRLAGGVQCGPVRGFPGLAGWMRRPRGPGWALVGDAGYFKDPITAHGITDALRDAELLARDLHRELTGVGSVPGATYPAVRDRLSHDFFDLTNVVAGFDWDLSELQRTHRAMSAVIGREYDVLDGLALLPTMASSTPGSRRAAGAQFGGGR